MVDYWTFVVSRMLRQVKKKWCYIVRERLQYSNRCSAIFTTRRIVKDNEIGIECVEVEGSGFEIMLLLRYMLLLVYITASNPKSAMLASG